MSCHTPFFTGIPMIINAAEHAWVISDPRFPIDLELASCPSHPPKSDYSAEHLISEMKLYGIDRTVISHVCYYGRVNDYTSYAVKTWPDRFAGIGLLVGHRLFAPGDLENPDRLTFAMQEQGLAGLRLSPIYDKAFRWFDDPMMYPFWERAQELGAVFNIFLGPDQVGQVASMAERFPGVKVVIDHIAMIDITAPDEDGFGPLLQMNRLSNVYVRTSLHNPSREATPYRDVWPFLERIYDAYGPERILYANFFEYLIMKEMIPFFTETDKEWILGRTSEGIYW
jgi:L-fuconolactonase